MGEESEKDNKEKVILEFAPAAYSILESIAKKSGDKTNAEVVRNALRLYEWYINVTSEGYKIHLAKEGEDTVREIELHF